MFESEDEQGYTKSIKREVDEQFELINTKTYYYIKKSVRKILRRIKTYIRYSKNKETEVELLIYFCRKLKDLSPSIKGSIVLTNLYHREIASSKKKVSILHEDLQFDYESDLASLSL